METIAICNQKGGVGKTTVTLLLAEGLAHRGLRVLVCDLDPQANATSGAGVDAAAGFTIADALLEPRRLSLSDVARVSVCGFDVAPADTSLALKERNRSTGDEHHLAELLADADGYDVALIDCPPSLGVLTVNALVAADRFLLVADASRFALQGTARLLETVAVVRRYFDPSLEFAGLVVNLTDHTREAQRRIREGEAGLGPDTLCVHLPRRVVVKEAIACGRTLRSYGDDRGADGVVGRVDTLAERLVASRVG